MCSTWCASRQRPSAQNGSAGDRVRLDEYFESVRSVEQRLEATMKPQKRWINQGKFPLERPGAGIPATRPEHLRLMMDILVLALWTDTTRISAFMIGGRADQRGLLVRHRAEGRLPLHLAPRRRAGAQGAVRKLRHLARGADGVLPQPPEESR